MHAEYRSFYSWSIIFSTIFIFPILGQKTACFRAFRPKKSPFKKDKFVLVLLLFIGSVLSLLFFFDCLFVRDWRRRREGEIFFHQQKKQSMIKNNSFLYRRNKKKYILRTRGEERRFWKNRFRCYVVVLCSFLFKPHQQLYDSDDSVRRHDECWVGHLHHCFRFLRLTYACRPSRPK